MKPAFQIPKAFGPLALLDWVCENGPGNRMFTRGSGGVRGDSASSLWLYDIAAPDASGMRELTRHIPEDDLDLMARLGGRAIFDTTSLTQNGLFDSFNVLGTGRASDGKSRYQDFIKPFGRDPFHWQHTAFVPTAAAFDLWRREGRQALIHLRSARESEREAAARTVVIGAVKRVEPRLSRELAEALPRNLRMPLPHRDVFRAYATAEVVRETDARLYLSEVRRLPDRTGGSWRDEPVMGRAPNLYVAKDAVMLDHASWTAGVTLAEIDDSFAQSMDAAAEAAMTAILPHLNAMNSRVRQNEAERDETIAEALARYAARNEAEDDGPDAPGPRP